MSEEFKKMILSKWKGKITYPFNYKDFEELTELIELFENQNKVLQQRIDKAIGFIDMIYETGSYSKSTGLDDEEVKELYSILQGKEME